MTTSPDFVYCSLCGAGLSRQRVDGHERPVCPNCGLVVYLDPKLVAAALVAQNGRILLVRRNIDPGIGLWALPAGYVDRNEAVEKAVQRETQEETGLSVKVAGLVGVYSDEGSPVVLIAYAVEPLGGELRGESREVQELTFFPPGSLPPLAFSRDRKIIQDWLRYQGKEQPQTSL